MKQEILVIALLVSILSATMMVAVTADTMRSINELNEMHENDLERIVKIENTYKQKIEELENNNKKLEAEVMFFISGGWK